MAMGSTHEFHFVMDRGMRERLRDMEVSGNCRGLSGVIVGILRVLAPVIRREHKWGKQRCAKYMAVCVDPEEVRDHVHVYVPEKLYRELKLLHQDLNFYSIAQLLRGLVRFFLGLVDVFGGDVFEELDGLFDRWREEAEHAQQTPREVIRQLLKILKFLPKKTRFVTIYSGHFSPFWILRI